jgi:hypothetical protein
MAPSNRLHRTQTGIGAQMTGVFIISFIVVIPFAAQMFFAAAQTFPRAAFFLYG